MSMHVRRSPVSTALPFSPTDLKSHLRVSHSEEDYQITNMGKTAAAEIEQFAQIALLTQTIDVTIFRPQSDRGLRLPVGPVDDQDVPTVTINGEAFTDFDFVGGIRPYLWWGEDFYRLTLRRIDIEYLAGFGASTSDVPSDLVQAIMDQTALHYGGPRWTPRDSPRRPTWRVSGPGIAGCRYDRPRAG